MLGKILREIKSAKPGEVQMFLSGVLKRARACSNPFYGDVGFPILRIMPAGTRDIRDEDHDQDEIYHFFFGGLHCFLVEVLTHAVREISASASLPLLRNYFDYFFDKHRGCTSCAKRVLALMPEDKRTEFLIDRAAKRKSAYLGSELHSPACMEMSLWVILMAPLSADERREIAEIIARRNLFDAAYLAKHSHQRSVRNFLADYRFSRLSAFMQVGDLVEGMATTCIHPPNAVIVLQGGPDIGKVRCTLCETTMLPTQLLASQ